MMKTRRFFFITSVASAFVFSFLAPPFLRVSAEESALQTEYAVPAPAEILPISQQEEQNADPVFVVKDAKTDAADLGNGNFTYRFYENPRPVYLEESVLKVRGAGWNRFHEEAKTRLKNRSATGYQFQIPLGENSSAATISSGVLFQKSANKSTSPKRVPFVQTVKDFATHTEYEDMYPGVRVSFRDTTFDRLKEITFARPPEELRDDDEITFWENISLPARTTVKTDTGTVLGPGEYRFLRTGLEFIASNGDTFAVTAAMITDATDSDTALQDLPYIVRIDKTGRQVALGIEVSAKYLNAPERVYPVVIDPVYTFCKSGDANACTITSLYLRYLDDRDTTRSDLFLGYYNDNGSPATRQPVVKFTGWSLPAGSTINSAYLKMKFYTLGSGTYTGNIPTVARKITTSWTESGIRYRDIRGTLLTVSPEVTVNYNSTDGQEYSWEVTSAARDWFGGGANNGVLVEETPAWLSGNAPSWPNRLYRFYSSRDTGGRGPYLEVNATVSQPDLTTTSGSLTTKVYGPGEILTATHNVINNGTGASAAVARVDYFFNKDTDSYDSSKGVGTQLVGGLSAGGSENKTFSFTIPANSSAGTYYLSYWIDSLQTISETNENNNKFRWSVTVGDPLEPNNDYSQAYDIGANTSYTNNGLILTAGEEDWFKFSYNSRTYYFKVRGFDSSSNGFYGIRFTRSGSAVTIETKQTSGTTDTYVILYAPDHTTELKSDDDSGTDYRFSKIIHDLTPVDPLEPNNNYSQAYNIDTNISYTNNNLILTAGEEDWFKFTYNAATYYFKVRGYDSTKAGPYGIQFTRSGSVVTIETTRVTDIVDTYVELYASDHTTLLSFDDDHGADNRFSKINAFDIAPIVHDVDINSMQFDSANMVYRDGDRVNLTVQLQNRGTVAETVPYTFTIIDQQTSAEFTMVNTSDNPTVNAGETNTITLSGQIPYSDQMSTSYRQFQARLRLQVSGDSDTDATLSPNTITGYRYYYSGGGGGGSPPPIDYDSDTYQDVEEAFVGTNATAVDAKPVFDPTQYSQYLGKKSDVNANNYGGDPVNIRTGAFEFTQTDFSLPGRGVPIDFTRTYNSKLSERASRLGNGWSFSYNTFYYQHPDTKNIQLYHGGALASVFTTSDGGQTFKAPEGVFDTLVREGDALVYRTIEGTRYVFSNVLTNNLASIERIVDTNGNATVLSYTEVRGVPLLSRVTDASGRSIELGYGGTEDSVRWDKIVRLQDTFNDAVASRVVSYTYDDSGNLVGARDNRHYNGTTEQIFRSFTYDANNRLTTYTDPRGTVLRNEYDADGRVIKQYELNPNVDASGTDRLIYELTYEGPHPNAPGSASCTLLRSYRSATDSFTDRVCFNDVDLKIYHEDGAGNVERWTYNADGMPTSHVNQNNNTSSYTYDARRRLTKEILPDISDLHTEIVYTYEDGFNRLIEKKETVTASVGGALVSERVTRYAIDPANGNVMSTMDALGNTEQFTYGQYGNVFTYTDQLGSVTTYHYDASGNYRTEESGLATLPDGTTQQVVQGYEYDVYGNKTKIISPRNAVSSFEYDTKANLRKIIDPRGFTRLFTYDLEGHRITEIDERGFETLYVYDKDIAGTLLTVQKTGENGEIIQTNRAHNFIGGIVSERDPLQRETRYFYNTANRLVRTETPVNTVITTYDGVGNVESTVNLLNQRIEYRYDARNNPAEVRAYRADGSFVSTERSYDGFSRVILERDALGNATRYTYDPLNRVTDSIDAAGGHSVFRYDAKGNKTGETSPRAGSLASLQNAYGDSITYMYDELGRLTNVINAENEVTTHWYDASGNRVKTIDRASSNGEYADHIHRFGYDPLNRLTHAYDAYNAVVSSTYDARGDMILHSAAGRTETFVYDGFRRLSEVHDPAGNVTKNYYDSAGNKTRVVHPDLTENLFVYDPGNRMTSAGDALNHAVAFTYDAVGNKLTETNRRGMATRYTYDALNRLTETKNPADTVTSFTYDPNGNRLSETITNASGSVHTATLFAYDVLNRIVTTTLPNDSLEVIQYDMDGNVVMKRDGNGDEIFYRYDALNRVQEKILPEGNTMTYGYDNWNNITAVSGTDEDVGYVYDKENRRTNEERRPIGLAPRAYTLSRTYAPDGKVETLTDAANITITYAYDTRGLLATVKRIDEELARYTYTSFGAPDTLLYGNGVETRYGYDVLHRMTSTTVKNGDTILFDEAYEYDRDGNRTALTTNGTSTAAYYYDPLNQLTDINYLAFTGESGDIDTHFDYDAFGNRTVLRDLGGTTNYSYNTSSGELSSYTQNNRLQTSLAYDQNGAIVREEITRLGQPVKSIVYDWDSQHRLRSLTYQTNDAAVLQHVPETVLSFAYDDAGNRVKKTTANGLQTTNETYYLNDGVHVINELGSDGAVTKSIIYGLGTIAEVGADGVLTFVHQDVLGSTALLTDEVGAAVQRYEYEPFGAIMGMDGTRETKYLFTGQEFDPESELYYYNARYYNLATGRFISRDPVRGRAGDVLGANAYIYVRNNPLRYVDPTGMWTWGGVWDSVVDGASAVGDAVVEGAKYTADAVVDTVERTAGVVVGVGEGAWDTVTTVADMVTHPVETVVGLGNAAVNIGTATWDYGGELINDPVQTLTDTGTGIADWAGDAYEDFNSKSPYEQGKAMGFWTEKIAEVVFLTKGAGSAAKLGSAEKAVAFGKAGETAAGIGAEAKTAIPSLTGTAVKRIPDKLADDYLLEVKNVKKLTDTPQLKDFELYSKVTGRDFILETRPNTVFSETLQSKITSGNIIHRVIGETLNGPGLSSGMSGWPFIGGAYGLYSILDNK